MSRTINLIPSWEAAVQVYCAVLENPNASPEGRATARDEIYRLARAFDDLNAEPDEPEIEHLGQVTDPAANDEESDSARWRAERRYQNAAERDELDLY